MQYHVILGHVITGPVCRDHSGYGLSQWEMMLHCNTSHWLSPYPEWSLVCTIPRNSQVDWPMDSPHKGSIDVELLYFLLAWSSCLTNSWVIGDLKCHDAHMDPPMTVTWLLGQILNRKISSKLKSSYLLLNTQEFHNHAKPLRVDLPHQPNISCWQIATGQRIDLTLP